MVTCIYYDCCDRCDALQPQIRDLLTIRSRVEAEGLSFLTITLPDLGKDFEKALDQGFISPTLFRGFRKIGKIPAFLQGFFGLIFDKWSGRILYNEEISSDPGHYPIVIECVRQLAYAFKKLRVACTPAREYRAVQDYKSSESDLSEPVSYDQKNDFLGICRLLWSGVFGSFNPFSSVPKHGPGATADYVFGNSKYSCRLWHDRLEASFPLLSNAFHNWNAFETEDFKKVTIVTEEQEQPVRVVFVPKTLKSPRVIAIEPCCIQYSQQGLSEMLVKALQIHPLTAGHINFDDQSINRSLALTSSKDGRFATLDLSSASDRVPRDLALCMFQSNPDLMDAIDACRSMKAELPSGEVLTLRKFASMGSALCFPVESMYFYTLCIGALLDFHNLPVTFLNIRKVSRNVYVYGDDIVVPTDCASFVAEYLQKYYCKVNTAKSFWTGKFRESCGMDAYLGESVTPTYFRELPPSNKKHVKSLVSWVSTGNQFYKRGFWRTADHIKKRCEAILGKLPIVLETSPALGWHSFQSWYSTDRWNMKLHRSEIRAWVPQPVYRKSCIDGMPALLKCLLSLERRKTGDATVDPKHLERAAKHGVFKLVRRWTTPH